MFFAIKMRSFDRMDPKIFLRVLENVGDDYHPCRRSVLTPRIFYSHGKNKKLLFLKVYVILMITGIPYPPSSMSTKFQKSPSTYVCPCEMEGKCRVTLPFVSADRYDPREA